MKNFTPPALAGQRAPNRWDFAAMLLVMGILVAIIDVGRHTIATPLTAIQGTPIHLDPAYLPGYALRTAARMFAALFVSILFTFTYAPLAAKSRRAGLLLIPILDILQSVPILGFLSFTVLFFLGLFPGQEMGAEFASIFVIFTSQAWNMAFSFYQSLTTLPADLQEAARSFRLSPWQKFWRLDVPFAMPGLVWNTMLSMSGGWFFVVASEAVTVGNTTFALPGIGSYVATALEERNLRAIFYAILAMLVVILLYDQLIFRPLVAWSDKFRFETTASVSTPEPWMLKLLRRTRLFRSLGEAFGTVIGNIFRLRLGRSATVQLDENREPSKLVDGLWYALIAAVGALCRLADRRLRVHHAALARSWHGDADGRLHDDSRHRADGDRSFGLGADRRMDRAAAESHAHRPADRPIPCRLPRQPAVPAGGRGDRVLPCECQHLADRR